LVSRLSYSGAGEAGTDWYGDEKMVRKITILLMSALALLLLISCMNNSTTRVEQEDSQYGQYAFGDISIHEQLNEHVIYLTGLAASPRNQVVHVGEAEVSRTGIAFMIENRTDLWFLYGDVWSLAYYADGRWVPVAPLPGAVFTARGMLLTLQSGGIQLYHISWECLYGELPLGKYMFVRPGALSDWDPNQGEWNQVECSVYALAEFFITENCLKYLPSIPCETSADLITLVEYRDITPYGMTIVVENASRYGIEIEAHIQLIMPERYAGLDYPWELRQHHLTRLPYFWIDNPIQKGFMPKGGQLEFFLDWSMIYGKLPPEDYILVLNFGGRVYPPHPTGWTNNDALILLVSV